MKRLIFAVLVALGFVQAWHLLDRMFIGVVGQPSMTGPMQFQLEQPFFETLAETTGLPLDVEYRTIDTMGIRDDYQLHLLKSGALDVVTLRFLQNASAEPSLVGIDPLGLNTSFDTARAVAAAYSPVLDARLQERFDTKLLGVWPFGPQVFFCKSKIEGLRDLVDKKIRIGNINFAPMIARLGGHPIVIPFDDVAEALKTGLVDCAITSATSGNYAGWADHTDYYFPLGMQMGLNGYVIALKKWSRLSREQQRVMEKAFRGHVDRMWRFARSAHEDASTCTIGGPCLQGKPHNLKLVEPREEDYALIREIFFETTFRDWAARCDKVYADCAADWRARVAPILDVIPNANTAVERVLPP